MHCTAAIENTVVIMSRRGWSIVVDRWSAIRIWAYVNVGLGLEMWRATSIRVESDYRITAVQLPLALRHGHVSGGDRPRHLYRGQRYAIAAIAYAGMLMRTLRPWSRAPRNNWMRIRPMTRSLSLVAALVAGLALPAMAENATETAASAAPQSTKAPAQTQIDKTPVPFKMVRTLGGNTTLGDKTCSRFVAGRRVVWNGPKPPQAQ
jgi:hypothetical protein